MANEKPLGKFSDFSDSFYSRNFSVKSTKTETNFKWPLNNLNIYWSILNPLDFSVRATKKKKKTTEIYLHH